MTRPRLPLSTLFSSFSGVGTATTPGTSTKKPWASFQAPDPRMWISVPYAWYVGSEKTSQRYDIQICRRRLSMPKQRPQYIEDHACGSQKNDWGRWLRHLSNHHEPMPSSCRYGVELPARRIRESVPSSWAPRGLPGMDDEYVHCV
jgi:hypothetical protein